MRLLREILWRYTKDEAMLNAAAEALAFIADGRIGLALTLLGLGLGAMWASHVASRLSSVEERLADAERFINKPPTHAWVRRC